MTLLPSRRFARAVLGLVLGGLLLAAVAWAGGVGPRSTDGEPLRPGRVVLVGVTGLSWDDVTPETMPTLSRWQAEGAAAAIVVRGTREVTCPADGWLTLSAGQRVAALAPGEARSGCPEPEPTEDEAGGVVWAAWEEWQAAADETGLGARLGSLAAGVASAGGCVSASGTHAALGAADPAGRAGTGDCAVELVDGGSVGGPTGAAALDAQLAELEPLPKGTTVVVAGLADPTDRPGMRAVVVTGQGSGLLASPSTRQHGLVQTPDLTATVIALAGREVPAEVAGRPLRVLPATAPVDAQAVRDVAAASTLMEAVLAPLMTALVALALLGLGAARLVSRPAVAVVATVAEAGPAAMFLAGTLPWWRVARADASGGDLGLVGAALGGSILVWAVLLAAVAWAGPWRRAVTGPPAVVAALTVLVVCVDVVLGAPLGLTSPLGFKPLTGGRFYGLGNIGLGVVVGAVVLLAGVLAAVLAGRRLLAAGSVLALGAAVAVVDGMPQWGADFGGVPTVLVATGLLALAAAGVRLTVARVVGVGAAAVGAAALLMVLDWLRPPDERTHLGAFVQTALDGQAWDVVHRKLEQSVGLLLGTPAAWLAVLLLAAGVWGLATPASPPGRLLAPLWRVPLLRETTVALLVGLVVGWLVNDTGVAILGLGLAVYIAGMLAVWVRLSDVPAGTPPAGPAPTTRPGTAAPGAAGPASPAR